MQAVICPFELDDLVASGGRAREAHGVHGSFGAAVAEADHLDRETIANLLRQLPLHVVRHAEHSPGAEPPFANLRDLPKLRPVRNIAVRIEELRMVEDVEELSPEINVGVFGYRNGLKDRKISVAEMRPAADRTFCVPERS